MISEMCLLLGLLAVASNPSPYFAALGLVWGAGAGCFILVKNELGFLSLILFLIYLGGMMVVFAYCSALVAEPYPEAWGSYMLLCYSLVCCFSLMICWMLMGGSWCDLGYNLDSGVLMREWWGISELLGSGGCVLFLGGWSLLLTLFVVLEVVRGHSAGALQAV
uniref:NADH-ubiquinone oxidoreductase chain 6 n=1 Tax=Zhangixalus dennysi TaxID=3136583 RepID=A0A0H3UN22_9NEOB|nr:NADH dehydrogenase subunit 6 [Rhacophorus dennysi]AIU99188.1 NADH dehydrogenase subunit 6 [Rhacophorus dennysi]ALC75292.1 NADH dehydrogenase subunit 6 [Rhacophorus dennysi]UAJ48173.1 NADH dehydrogenase subunit 6 [Rhacophorus sp.]